MKKLLFILALTFFFSCSNEPVPFEPPFVIVGKTPSSNHCPERGCYYTFADANGRMESFCDSAHFYYIGDTIK